MNTLVLFFYAHEVQFFECHFFSLTTHLDYCAFSFYKQVVKRAGNESKGKS